MEKSFFFNLPNAAVDRDNALSAEVPAGLVVRTGTGSVLRSRDLTAFFVERNNSSTSLPCMNATRFFHMRKL